MEIPKLIPNTWEDLEASIENHICCGAAFNQPRTEKVLEKYKEFKVGILETYNSLNDYVLAEFFDCETILKGNKITANIGNEQKGKTMWRSNDFPPYLDDGIKVEILWNCNSKPLDNLSVEKLIGEHLGKDFEYVWGRSLSGTIAKVDHVHVYYRKRRVFLHPQSDHALFIRACLSEHGFIDEDSVLIIKRFPSGYANFVYHARDESLGRDFVFRIIGHRKIPRNSERENLTFTFFHESGLGPKPYMQRESWRVEEFISGEPVTKNQFRRSKELRVKCAKLLANIHKLRPNFEPCFSFDSPTDILKILRDSIDFENHPMTLREINEEIFHLDKQFQAINPIRCFCHGDYKPSNLIIDNCGKLFVVDIELSGFRFRAIEISFLLMVGTQRECENAALMLDRYPKKELIETFAEVYLNCFHDRPPSETERRHLLEEIRVGYLVNLLRCGLYFAKNAEIGKTYLKQYFLKKNFETLEERTQTA